MHSGFIATEEKSAGGCSFLSLYKPKCTGCFSDKSKRKSRKFTSEAQEVLGTQLLRPLGRQELSVDGSGSGELGPQQTAEQSTHLFPSALEEALYPGGVRRELLGTAERTGRLEMHNPRVNRWRWPEGARRDLAAQRYPRPECHQRGERPISLRARPGSEPLSHLILDENRCARPGKLCLENRHDERRGDAVGQVRDPQKATLTPQPISEAARKSKPLFDGIYFEQLHVLRGSDFIPCKRQEPGVDVHRKNASGPQCKLPGQRSRSCSHLEDMVGGSHSSIADESAKELGVVKKVLSEAFAGRQPAVPQSGKHAGQLCHAVDPSSPRPELERLRPKEAARKA